MRVALTGPGVHVFQDQHIGTVRPDQIRETGEASALNLRPGLRHAPIHEP